MPGQLQDPDYQAFVESLVSARAAASVTQADLAVRLNKPQSYVSKYERFERRLDVSEWCRAATALGMEPAALLARTLLRNR